VVAISLTKSEINSGEEPMKCKCCVSVLVILLLTTANMASAFRCDNGLVALGDHSFQVLQKCGTPNWQEEVGYTLTSDGKRELKIEHWIYGPKGGRYHLLVFEGGILTKISDFPER
jgi:hypothetical protein